MTPTEQAAELRAIASVITKAANPRGKPTPERAIVALEGYVDATNRLLVVQRSIAASRDATAVAAIPEGWGSASALASRLGVSAQAVSKWVHRATASTAA